MARNYIRSKKKTKQKTSDKLLGQSAKRRCFNSSEWKDEKRKESESEREKEGEEQRYSFVPFLLCFDSFTKNEKTTTKIRWWRRIDLFICYFWYFSFSFFLFIQNWEKERKKNQNSKWIPLFKPHILS